MEAGYTRIGQCALEVVFYDLFYRSAAPPDYLDAMVCKFFLCAVSHVPSKHKTYAHLLQRSGNVAFAATPLGGRKCGRSFDSLVFDAENRVVGTMPEVIVHAIVSRGHCNFDHSLVLGLIQLTQR